jgi:uncharacterized RDD family membrane protein YckC
MLQDYAGLPPARLGRRAFALAIDWLASLLVARLAFGQFAYGSMESSFATLAIFFVEVTLLTWLIQGSFGQLVVGLRVVSVTGGRLSLWRAALRTALVCLVIPAVVYDEDGRGLHDRAVGSVCVRVR